MEDIILKRRSVRRFKDAAVERELIDRILEAACAAPSACNRRPVDFYVITAEEKLDELSKCGRFTRMKSPLMIIVVGNLSRALPLGMAEYWIQDAAAASENILEHILTIIKVICITTKIQQLFHILIMVLMEEV